MAKVRVPVANTAGKSVLINSGATIGATIGTDLRLPDGTVPTLTELAAALASEAVAAEANVSSAHVLWSHIFGNPFDFTGAADNDLTYRSGSEWIDTAGLLTWDGSELRVTGNQVLSNAAELKWFDGAADNVLLTADSANGDPDFASVVLLFPMDGLDGATDTTDLSNTPHTETFVGDAQIDTAQKKFETGSLLLDGTGDWLTIPDSADWHFGAGDFTIEGHMRFASLPSSAAMEVLASQYEPGSSQRSWFFGHWNDGGTQKIRFAYYLNGITINDVSADFTPSLDTWYHYAVSRVGADLFLFVDGVQKGSTHDISTSTLHDSTWVLTIGALGNSSVPNNLMDGWLDELRITKGVGRYSANFTPPVAAYLTDAVVKTASVGHADYALTVLGATVDVQAALTAISYGGITEANLVDKSAAEVITADWTFETGTDGLTLSQAGSARLRWKAIGAATDEVIWDMRSRVDGVWEFRARNDEEDNGGVVFDVQRTGFVVDSFNIQTALTAVSYGGITEANLVDKSAAETIAGDWEHTGLLIVAAGTEAAPSWHFTGDADTGIYSPGANIFAITVAGTEAVRYVGASVPLVQYGMVTGLTASTTQAQGEGELHASYNEVSVCANNDDTLTLPPAAPGCVLTIINNGAKRLQLFPASGDDLGLGIDQPDTIKAGASIFYVSYSATNWFDIATKFAGLLDSDVVGITANDILFFNGSYTHTGGLLTWDGSLLDITGNLQVSGDVGFYGTTAIAQQTGVAVSAAGIHAALVNLGLITA